MRKSAYKKQGRRNRNKGRYFELKVVKDLWVWFHGKIPWNKYETPDDGFSPPPEVSDHHLEMKNADTLNIWSALKQAEGDARKQKKKKWAVIFTRSYRKTYVAIPYDQWKRSL